MWLRSDNIPDRAGAVDKPVALSVLDAPVTVKRDRYGVPYIYAQSLADAIRAQGFVTAQDRLTQMLLTREAVNGRLAELIGSPGTRNDISVRVLGIRQLAGRFAAGLESPSREMHEWYLEGVNAYIATQEREFPLAVRMSGTSPAPYTLEDICAHYLLQAYDLTENWRSEWLAQRLVDRLGREKAAEISLVSVNPDDGSRWASDYALAPREPLLSMHEPQQMESGPVGGSNSWATSGPQVSAGRAHTGERPAPRRPPVARHLVSPRPHYARMAGRGRNRAGLARPGRGAIRFHCLGCHQLRRRHGGPVHRAGRPAKRRALPGRRAVLALRGGQRDGAGTGPGFSRRHARAHVAGSAQPAWSGGFRFPDHGCARALAVAPLERGRARRQPGGRRPIDAGEGCRRSRRGYPRHRERPQLQRGRHRGKYRPLHLRAYSRPAEGRRRNSAAGDGRGGQLDRLRPLRTRGRRR